MSQRKLYLASFGAIKWVGETLHGEHSAKLTTGRSRDEVLRLLKEKALETLPEAEGWQNHVFEATELTEDDLAALQNFLDHRFDDVEDAPTEFLM